MPVTRSPRAPPPRRWSWIVRGRIATWLRRYSSRRRRGSSLALDACTRPVSVIGRRPVHGLAGGHACAGGIADRGAVGQDGDRHGRARHSHSSHLGTAALPVALAYPGHHDLDAHRPGGQSLDHLGGRSAVGPTDRLGAARIELERDGVRRRQAASRPPRCRQRATCSVAPRRADGDRARIERTSHADPNVAQAPRRTPPRCEPPTCRQAAANDERPPFGGLSKNRRRPTLPGACAPSTIGAGGLNFSVRNGKRCFPAAMTAELSRASAVRSMPSGGCPHPQNSIATHDVF